MNLIRPQFTHKPFFTNLSLGTSMAFCGLLLLSNPRRLVHCCLIKICLLIQNKFPTKILGNNLSEKFSAEKRRFGEVDT
jgi:hypothetical protein